jgi:hypothetical protein
MDDIPMKNHGALAEFSVGFERFNSGALVGCVGAIDGIAIEIFKAESLEYIFSKTVYESKRFLFNKLSSEL